MKSIIIIFATIYSSQAFGQSASDNFYDKFPNSIIYSSDTIKEIYVLVSTHTKVESDIDTILKLDETKIKAFVADFNRNIILPKKTYGGNSYFEKVTAKQHSYGEKMYELVFVSKTNNKTFYYIKKNFIGLSVLDTGDLHILHSSTGQIKLYYKMDCINILKKYNLTYEQNSTRH
jgi:hypothetical protein